MSGMTVLSYVMGLEIEQGDFRWSTSKSSFKKVFKIQIGCKGWAQRVKGGWS